MQDRGLYEKILGIERPWSVRDVELSREEKRVIVRLTRAQSPVLRCPTCDATGPKYDRRTRRWRHLDTCQFKTIIEAEVPRITCSEHGVVQVSVPWAESGSRFTALFEALVISWLHEASILGVSRQMSLSWDEAAGIQERAVRRGLARRKCEPSVRISVDETSFRKRHKYVTVVSDQDTTNVVYVADGRETEALNGYYESIGEEACASLESVSMDMWQGYITATRNHVPNADQIIAFDKFHIVQHLGNAVDKVRREENRELTAAGDNRLKGTKWMWLKNPANMSPLAWWSFSELRSSRLRVARAWALKEAAMCLWDYVFRGWAKRAWKRWYSWAIRSRLEPMKRVARMIANHLEGILTAVVTGATNASAENLNGKIQWVKRMAFGFRNPDRFRNAIYFHLGGLDLYPKGCVRPT